MHASDGALLMAESNIKLSHIWIQVVCFKLILAPGAREKAAFVLDFFDIDDVSPFEFCFNEIHCGL